MVDLLRPFSNTTLQELHVSHCYIRIYGAQQNIVSNTSSPSVRTYANRAQPGMRQTDSIRGFVRSIGMSWRHLEAHAH